MYHWGAHTTHSLLVAKVWRGHKSLSTSDPLGDYPALITRSLSICAHAQNCPEAVPGLRRRSIERTDAIDMTHGKGKGRKWIPEFLNVLSLGFGGCGALAGLRILCILRSMEMPFQEARPENGARLVPTGNSALHKEDLSYKVSVGEGPPQLATGRRWAPENVHRGSMAVSRVCPAALLCFFAPKLDPVGSGVEIWLGLNF